MEGLPLSFDPKIFLFSIINFCILFFLLKKFLFTPIYNILQERKNKIKESLLEVEQIKKEREHINAEKEQIIALAEKKSLEIAGQAEKMKKEIIAKAKDEADKIIQASRDDIAREKEDLKKEMHVTLIDLVTTAVDKALININSAENKNKIVETAIINSLKEQETKEN